MKPISGLDATFLYAETPTSPMHVGSVVVIEGSIKFESFRETIKSRLHLVPKLRQRLVEVPFSIDYPYWVDDAHFDLEMHLQHIALPKPGNWRELRAVASKIFSEPLDRSRPLWSFTFVEGLDKIPQVPSGSVAIISKIHHVAIDGMAGAGILSLMFDMTPKPRKVKEPAPFEPEPLPNEFSMMLKSTMSFAEKPLKLPRLISDAVTATVKAGFLTRVQHAELPTVPFTAPPSPLNGIISARRKWNTAILSLDRIKKLKNIMEVTLNDVLLAICGGALRRYLLEKNKLPHKPLVAMVPISTRNKSEEKELGNQVSSMLVQLATHIEDPVERLENIHENTIRGKMYQGALGAKTLANMAEVVPFGLANQAARLYSRFHVAKMHNPVFNVVITNVPGPQLPLYLDGHKLLSVMGMAPIIDGMGLIITIFSYNGLVTVSPTSDVKTMPDLDIFSRYLRESANELEAAVLEHAKTKQNKKKKIQTKMKDEGQAEMDEFEQLYQYIKGYLVENAKFIKPNNGLFQFSLTGERPAEWILDLNVSPGIISRGKAENPEVNVTIRSDHFMRIAKGKLKFQTAFIQGRLKFKGDNAKAMKLSSIMTKMLPMR